MSFFSLFVIFTYFCVFSSFCLCFCFLCWVSISFFFSSSFLPFLIFSAFGGCFSFGADWVCSSLFCFLNLSCKQTYDSWRLGHVEPDDVVIAVVPGQDLDIFLHDPVCTQEWHCKRHSLTHPFPSTHVQS